MFCRGAETCTRGSFPWGTLFSYDGGAVAGTVSLRCVGLRGPYTEMKYKVTWIYNIQCKSIPQHYFVNFKENNQELKMVEKLCTK